MVEYLLACVWWLPQKEISKIKSWDWESGRPGCQTPWIVCQSRVSMHLGLPYMTNLHAVSRGPAGPTRQVERIPRPQVKKTLNSRWKMRVRKKNLFTCILSVTNQNKHAGFSLELLGRKLNIFPCCLGMLSEHWLFSPLLLIKMCQCTLLCLSPDTNPMNNITMKRLLTRLLHSELYLTTRQPQVLQKQIFFSLYQTQSNS